jgi:hypothetical protein
MDAGHRGLDARSHLVALMAGQQCVKHGHDVWGQDMTP